MDDGGCLSTIILSTINSGAQTNGSIGMNPLWVDIVIILLFIFINGFFAGTEMAIINLSDSRIQKEAEEGNKVANKLL